MLLLTANKKKMLTLVKAKGYTPTRKVQLVKGYRSRHWWLEWIAADGTFYSALLDTAAGRAFLGMRIDEKWECHELTLNELREFGMVEERADHG